MSGEEEENAIGDVALILEHKYEQLQQMSDDPTNQISQYLCVLGNLCPETVDEGIAMVPSIKNIGRALDEEAIEKMLTDLSLIKKFE
ncbi:hypothetical protein RND71_006528 [Anisodus tanguticus]|uniref:RNA polymerase Rpb4/RPC9 core domain-containing protein n=1 Tax=Anisodus tanguticus TaxID=243964 RepID=A0AAE1VT98_9SOLA|nr:hypothetical protein RND71_006528 [Anisodus tanguticus]